tara:strand:- start:5069 stop:5320 length:252 start_codon:yes stop_codon:yes gene_type:complete
MAIKTKIIEKKDCIGLPYWKLRVTQTTTKKTPYRRIYKYFDSHKEAIDFSCDKNLMKNLIEKELSDNATSSSSSDKSNNKANS